jgi:hypothetical protein
MESTDCQVLHYVIFLIPLIKDLVNFVLFIFQKDTAYVHVMILSRV